LTARRKTYANTVHDLPLVEDAAIASREQHEALGRLTGGLAHDLNNLIGVMMGAAESLVAALEPGSEEQRLAAVALDSAECGAQLVRRLLNLARRQACEPEVLPCTAVMSAMQAMAQVVVGADVTLDAGDPGAGLSCVSDRAELESALLNLCLNARDAMPVGGTLTLDVTAAQLSPAEAATKGLTPGDYVVFAVRDTGVGMTPATLARAIEPGFTTKSPARGAGLGLSTVDAFARRSGGGLEITSRRRNGTTARVYLPRAETSPASSTSSTSSSSTSGDARRVRTRSAKASQIDRELTHLLTAEAHVLAAFARAGRAGRGVATNGRARWGA
jgi:signal transduction histidine kinase